MGPAFLYMATVVILIIGVALVVTARHRKKLKQSYSVFLASGCVSLICPLSVGVLLAVAFLVQGGELLAAILMMSVMPVAAAAVGLLMLLIAWRRRCDRKLYHPVLISGSTLMLYPAALFAATLAGELFL